jgi:hypothetical protein
MLTKYDNPNSGGCVVPVVKSGGNRRRSITKEILDLKTSVKVVKYMAKSLEQVMEQMEILDKEKVATIRGQQQAEIVAQLHLDMVAKLEHSLQEKKVRNEYLDHLLGHANETSTNLEHNRQEVTLL